MASQQQINQAAAMCVKRIAADMAKGKTCDVGRYMQRYKALRDLSPQDHHDAWLMIHAMLPTN